MVELEFGDILMHAVCRYVSNAVASNSPLIRASSTPKDGHARLESQELEHG